MNPQLASAFSVYFTQRWALPAMAAVLVFWGLMLFAFSSMGAETPPMMLTNVLGLPIMGTAFWVVSVAKWQFVNPRARLLPGFAEPHLKVMAFWFLLGLVGAPILVSCVTGLDPISSLAYSLACGATFAWGMHTFRPVFTFGALLVFFLPMAPWLSPAFTNPLPIVQAIAVATIAAGAVGVGLLLKSVARLTEESDEYFVPAHAQSGKASRMEQSEARRLIARQTKNSWLMSYVTDRWNDPLADRRCTSVKQRQALLPHGLVAAPALFRCLGMLGLMLMVVVGNASVIPPSANTPALAVTSPAAFVFVFIGPTIAAQMLAMHRPRMQTELLYPMSRREYVSGVFGAMSREAVLHGVTSVVLLAGVVLVVAPEVISAERVVGVTFVIAAGLLATFGLAMRMALVESGVKRMIVLMLGLYVFLGVLGGAIATHYHGHPVAAYAMVSAVLLVGVLLVRHAYGKWMRAELG